jgi:hypothetical protein
MNVNTGWVLSAIGWMSEAKVKDSVAKLDESQQAFLNALVGRAAELGEGGEMIKIKASAKGVSSTSKGKYEYADGTKSVDWRDGILHAARAVADMHVAGLSNVTLNVEPFYIAWKAKRDAAKANAKANE